jgi:hypothetical protein
MLAVCDVNDLIDANLALRGTLLADNSVIRWDINECSDLGA